MSARTGMTELIVELRSLTEAGQSDYVIVSETYWNDEQLQNILDMNRRDQIHNPITPYPVVGLGGTLEYYEYRSGYGYYEATDGGTQILYLQDATGAKAGTSLWSADYRRGVFTFSSNTLGTAFYITGRTYDLNSAAADVWRRKAAHYAPSSFDFSTDNHSISRAQVYDHALDMVAFFEGISGNSMQVINRERSDVP